MHVSDSTVRWCGGLCLPLHDLQCAFYLHVVSLGRKLHAHLACVCNFEGLYYYYARLDKVKVIDMNPQQEPTYRLRGNSLPLLREGIYVG